MNTLHVNLIGRFGNQMFQYATSRAYSEQSSRTLTFHASILDEVFDLPDHTPNPSTCNEWLPDSYRQNQDALIYTRKLAKEWFKFKPEIEDKLRSLGKGGVVSHRRVGDYASLGYVVVSMKSLLMAITQKGFVIDHLITEENPTHHPDFTGELSFLPDFWRMMHADVLFRGNSSFSWWAATLSDAQIFSPVIDGLEGSKEQDVEYVAGNWPKLSNLPMCTDLHLKDE